MKKLLVPLLFLVAVTSAASSATPGGTNLRVAVSGTGAPADGESWAAGISADGRFVAFTSVADNLVDRDLNSQPDAFVRDLRDGRTERVSVATDGTESNLDSAASSISANGRYVVFDSSASNLVDHDVNARRDVFVHDRRTDKTTLVSVSSRGRQGNGDSDSGVISANGRYVAFVSEAATLVPRDTNRAPDVFVRDLKTNNTFRADVGPLNRQSARGSETGSPSISAGGRYVAFASDAPNLVRHDSNGVADVFVRDLRRARTTRVSVSSRGRQAVDRAGYGSDSPSISANGRYVAFVSNAGNLGAHDTNRKTDVFLRDLLRRRTTRLGAGRGASSDPRISPDGLFVAFARDGDPAAQVYVRDVAGRRTIPASVGADSLPGDDTSGPPAGLSEGGRYLAFSSLARNLVVGETAGEEAYVRDLGSP